MEALSNVAAAFGLAGAAGLNAYLPLLVIGLMSRFTDLISLSAPWDTLENAWVLGVVAVLLAVEVTVDKFPVADSINDAIQTFVRPVAGALLFAANGNVIADIHPALALVCGLLVAGGVHVVKTTARPVVTATTAGVGNPIVSTAEDAVSATTSVLSIVVPVLAALLLIALVALLTWWIVRRRRARRRGRR